MVRLRALLWLLVVSSLGLGIAGAVATGLACGSDFLWWLFDHGRCATPGTPAMVWAGAVASFGVGMKVFWVCLGVILLWKARQG